MPHGWMMGPGMLGGFMMVFWTILWLAFLALVIAGIVWIVRNAGGTGGRGPTQESVKEDSALKILRERYARGEIDHQEFEERRKNLAA